MSTQTLTRTATVTTATAAAQVSALLASAEQQASLISGANAELTSSLVRAMLNVVAAQYAFAVAGDTQAAENVRHLCATLHLDLYGRRYPGTVVPAALLTTLLQLAVAGSRCPATAS